MLTCHAHDCVESHMGWLRLVGSLKLYVSFAKEPYQRDYILLSLFVSVSATDERIHAFTGSHVVCCSVLQCVAACCSVLQCSAVCVSVL